MSREDVLWRIAELYTSLVDPLAKAGIPGDGDMAGVLSMPETYTPTVREFERLCRTMHTDRTRPLIELPSGEKVSVRKLYWHLSEFHLKAVRVVRHVPKTAVKNGRVRRVLGADNRPVTEPKRDVIRNPKAREDLARQAVRWIAAHWSLGTEPMLPQPVIEELRAAA